MAYIIDNSDQLIKVPFKGTFHLNVFEVGVFGISLVNLYAVFIFCKLPIGLSKGNRSNKTENEENCCWYASRFHKTEISIPCNVILIAEGGNSINILKI
jgi:hypothetical protein